MSDDTDPRLLRLHAADNVLTVIAPLTAGESLRIAGLDTVLPIPLAIGHKVAARAIAAGEKVLKYGAPIGSATRAIAPGEHVHTHNLRSDYLPTFQRGAFESRTSEIAASLNTQPPTFNLPP